MIRVLVLTDFSSGYSRNLLKGIVRYSQEVGGWTFYRMPLYYRMLHGDQGVVEWAEQWKADAIIAQLDDLDLNLLRNLHIPIIVQNHRDRIPGVCNLTGDYLGTGRIAAEFFLQKGFYNFAYYGITDTVWSRERGEGYRDRLKEEGHRSYQFLETSSTKEQWSYNLESLGKWLISLPKPIGLFACDDQFALQASEACKIFGIQVPDEVAILGVDNDELICNIASPPLSSILLDVENGGYTAARMLHQLIRKRIEPPCNISVEALQIIHRQSTQKYVAEDPYILDTIAYIEQNYASQISIAGLLERIPLSRRVLEKRFKQSTGVTLYHFIQRHRVDCFARQLIFSARAVKDIAFACGFDDYKNVSRVFHHFKKMTPSQYRKKYGRTTDAPQSSQCNALPNDVP